MEREPATDVAALKIAAAAATTVHRFTAHSGALCKEASGFFKVKSPSVHGPIVLACNLSSVVWTRLHGATFENKTVKPVF